MKTVLGWLVPGLVLSLVSCSAPQTASPPPEKSAPVQESGWQAKMNTFAELLARAMPAIHKNRMLTMDERQDLISVAIDFHKLSRSVNHGSNTSSQDLTFMKTAAALEDELSEVQDELKHGKDRLAQLRMASITNYCISCHTMREGYAKDFSSSLNESVKNLSNRDKAEFFAATRQFDQAIIHYEYALTDADWAKKDPKGWNESALKLLAILVRVKNDPNLSLEMVSRFFDAQSYPPQFREAARIWRREIKKWESAEKAKSTSISTTSVDRLLAQGTSLNMVNGGGIIQDLRASRILHLLKTANPEAKTNPDYQKWLLYSGEVAQRLQDLNLWDQPRDYFALCVQMKPKSSIGNRCLKSFILSAHRELQEKDQKKFPPSLQRQIEALKAL